ncbi:uncharacterized protein LOC134848561 [Symsagittifera roscoffensis]|uniref:uncharacterized protein LOC134848561 n=1 Tax=Symsagittifera roscoffensis TaxID=84072 RepID=UPI00307B427B
MSLKEFEERRRLFEHSFKDSRQDSLHHAAQPQMLIPGASKTQGTKSELQALQTRIGKIPARQSVPTRSGGISNYYLQRQKATMSGSKPKSSSLSQTSSVADCLNWGF